jgi:hypothetical protein
VPAGPASQLGSPPHAPPGLLSSAPPAGPRASAPVGPTVRRPGWAGSPLPRVGWQSSPPAGPELKHPAGPLSIPGQADLAPPGCPYSIPAGPDLSVLAGLPSAPYSGRARPGFPGPGRITPPPGRINLLQGRDLPLRDIFFIRLRLQHFVPVLGRLQAQTGTSSIIVCWSWDAPWLRPAYSSSPSQSYPQEEDKTDDMVILKTDARRRSQGLQGQTSMGLAHDHDAGHSTEDGTVLMQAIV